MSTDHRDELKNIRTFPSLVRYLRDNMGWPIGSGDFEEITFEYTPEELGIDTKNAAKIQEIKRLRPLVPDQPWGIFFIKFEPKQLPVMVLRRILSKVVLKKRTSANKSERQAWAADDLLFVSNYGKGTERQISFAHFSTPCDHRDLSTLKVLGWDNLDTALHLDAVARELTEHLMWPEDDRDTHAWREQWRAAFTLRHREVITTSKELSIRLAELARAIRDRIKTVLAIETEQGPLTKLMKAFQESLVHDLDADGFSDMYAQTITYGLLSARIADPHKKTVDDFAGHMRTNPFLRELMETFLKVGGRHRNADGPDIDFDELGVGEVMQLLDNANIEAVVLDFGDKNPQEDPVIHFYEFFLNIYNKQLKIQRGVFYTPWPVVSYIVRSVHEILQTQFGLADGLADTTTWGEMVKKHTSLKLPPLTEEPGEKRTISPNEPFVQILDPATGTATFLVEVIDVIHRTLMAKWTQQRLTKTQQHVAWNDYVPKHLLPRLHAFELMMAPYAIAHMKIGLKLAETGYRFATEERARIYLTNALEPKVKQLPQIGFDALAHEAAAVNEIKWYKRFTVVIGNPPYSGHSANNGEWATKLTDRYYNIEGVNLKEANTKWLRDDYVKFFGLSQAILGHTGLGVLGFITNHGFIDNPTFRGMRYSLLRDFRSHYFLHLNGSAKKAQDGQIDQNVFDIQQGVAVALISRGIYDSETRVEFNNFLGSRELKYSTLTQSSVGSTSWTSIAPAAPLYLFVPENAELRSEFQAFVKLTDAMPQFSLGCLTKRDGLVIGFSKLEIRNKILTFIDKRKSDVEAATEWNLPLRDKDMWDVASARNAVSPQSLDEYISLIDYRIWDTRYLFAHKDYVARLNHRIIGQMKHPNIAFVTVRQLASLPHQHFWVVNRPSEQCIISTRTKEGGVVFPLYLYPQKSELQFGSAGDNSRDANFTPDFIRRLTTGFGLGPSAFPAGITPEDIFYYAYTVFHSLGYRSRYAELLKADFPRLPVTGNLELFRALIILGGELVSLHLLDSPKLNRPITEFFGSRNLVIEKPSWSKNTVWLDKAQTTGFKGVPEAVWNFHIGSYQVCVKWLKDRKGSTLSNDDIAHYQKIIVALSETIRLMREIDEVIDAHGGWPEAFANKSSAKQESNHISKVADSRMEYNTRKDKRKP